MSVETSVITPPGATASAEMSNRDTLSNQVVAQLHHAYNIGDWLDWRRTPKGSSNVSFFVTTSSGKYVLRRSNERKRVEAIKFELRLINYLAALGYPVPTVASTRSGEGYVKADGTLYLMTALISGQSYDAQRPTHFLEAGRGLGLYHRLVAGFPGPYPTWPNPSASTVGPESINELQKADRLIKRSLSAEEYNRMVDASVYLEGQFVEVHAELAKHLPSLTKLVIQGSYGKSALLFDCDKLTGVVDYDRAHYDIRIADLAYTLKAFCRISDKNSKDYRIGLDGSYCQKFLSAYQEVEPLPQTEIQHLPLVFRAQRLTKVEVKCRNLVSKNAITPQKEKDMRKLASILEKEALRLTWLEEHGRDLLAALN